MSTYSTQYNIHHHAHAQACRVLSLENGTVVKQGVSPRGLCQGVLMIMIIIICQGVLMNIIIMFYM